MTTSYTLARCLFCVVLLFVVLESCPSTAPKGCSELWVDCPDDERDGRICSNCKLIYDRVEGDVRWFKWRYCDKEIDFTWFTGVECTLVVK